MKVMRFCFFLETHFHNYLDTYKIVSETAKIKLFEKHEIDLNSLQIFVRDEFSNRFIEVISPLFNFRNDPKLTVHQLIYLKRLIPDLVELYKKNNSINESSFHDFLIYNNFNTLYFAQYITAKIISDIAVEDYLENKLMALLEKEKDFNQIIINKTICFEWELQNVKDKILQWIEQEVKYSKRKLTNSVANQTRFEFKTKSMFLTSMSVSQLACLFKAFKDINVIINPVQKDIFKAVADSFITENTKSISAESTYNKQYDIDDASKEAVRQILKRMIKSIV